MLLENRVALVTGSSRGIGRAIAVALASEGCNLIVNYVKHREEAKETEIQVRQLGRETLVIQADVADPEQAQEMVGRGLNEFGALDILVNNAGIIDDRIFHKMTDEQWHEVLAVDLTGIFNCTRAVIQHMRQRGYGRIVNIASVVGQGGAIGQVNYAAAKAGVIGFTKALALECASRGITVNAVAPGYIETDMLRTLPPEIRARLLKEIPVGRFGRPEDVAQAVLYLVSEAGNYVTGHVLAVNGGIYR